LDWLALLYRAQPRSRYAFCPEAAWIMIAVDRRRLAFLGKPAVPSSPLGMRVSIG